MQLIIERREKPNSFTGLSLVLFLFLSMLSMMAAYEAGKPTDDLRSTVIASLNEHAAPGADAESDHRALLPSESRSVAPQLRPFEVWPAHPASHSALPARAFNARAPPAQTASAS